MKRCLYLIAFFLIALPRFSKAAYKMEEAAPVKISNEAVSSSTQSALSVDNATNRKANNVAFPRSGAGSNPEIPVMASLSERYNVPTERLQYYRSLHFGYREIVPSLVVAKQAQVEVGRVLKLRMDGLSWDAIAKSFFIDLKPLNKEVSEVLKPIEQRLSDRALSERPANQPGK